MKVTVTSYGEVTVGAKQGNPRQMFVLNGLRYDNRYSSTVGRETFTTWLDPAKFKLAPVMIGKDAEIEFDENGHCIGIRVL